MRLHVHFGTREDIRSLSYHGFLLDSANGYSDSVYDTTPQKNDQRNFHIFQILKTIAFTLDVEVTLLIIIKKMKNSKPLI